MLYVLLCTFYSVEILLMLLKDGMWYTLESVSNLCDLRKQPLWPPWASSVTSMSKLCELREQPLWSQWATSVTSVSNLLSCCSTAINSSFPEMVSRLHTPHMSRPINTMYSMSQGQALRNILSLCVCSDFQLSLFMFEEEQLWQKRNNFYNFYKRNKVCQCLVKEQLGSHFYSYDVQLYLEYTDMCYGRSTGL